MSELTEGTYTVSVVEHGLVQINDKPVAKLSFSNGAEWFGSFTGGAAEWTTKGLVNAGFLGTKIEQLNVEGAINPKHKCSIKMQNETYEGKTKLKVKFINKVSERMTDQDVVTSMAGMNVDVQLAEARAELGLKGVAVTKKSPLQSTGADLTSEEIPF